MKIAVISDTHGLLRSEVEQILLSCDVILHAGDFDRPIIKEWIEGLGPVTHMVCGNNDYWADENELPYEAVFREGGFSFYMTHRPNDVNESIARTVDFVICGHTHRIGIDTAEHPARLNPGSCGPCYYRGTPSMLLLHLFPETHTYSVEEIDLSEP